MMTSRKNNKTEAFEETKFGNHGPTKNLIFFFGCRLLVHYFVVPHLARQREIEEKNNNKTEFNMLIISNPYIPKLHMFNM